MTHSLLVKILFFVLIIPFLSVGQSDSLKTAQWLDSALLLPQQRNYYERKVVQLARQASNEELANSWSLLVKYYLGLGEHQKASALVIRGKKRFRNSSELYADFLSLEGSIAATKKEFQSAIRCYKKALAIYERSELSLKAAYIRNNIANVFFNLNDFNSAYTYAKSSFRVVYAEKDTVRYPQIAGILAISEVKTGRLISAKRHAGLAIRSGTSYNNPIALLIGHYAMGDYWLRLNALKKARKSYEKVVELATALQQLQFESFGRTGLLATYVRMKDFEAAIQQGQRAMEINTLLKTHVSDYTVYQQLSEAYHGIGNYGQAYRFLAKANKMYRNYSSLENKKVIQELLTRYEAEKKERELSEKELELTRAVSWILTLFAALFLLLFGFVFLRRRNKLTVARMQLENERNQLEAFVEGEQRERERLAADIHDGITSTLTGLSLQLEQTGEVTSRELLAKQIQQIRNEVRLISKNISPFNFKEEGWNAAFRRYIETVQHETFAVFFLPDFQEERLHNQRGIVLYRVLQELVQNTLKHAGASECELVLMEEKAILTVRYADNGCGTNPAELERGNGWQSVLLRIKALKGTISLPEHRLSGFHVVIEMPIA